MNYEFSVLAFSETWLTDDLMPLFEIPNYNALHHCRKLRPGGGVSLYLNKEFHFNYRIDLTCSSENDEIESLFLEIPACDLSDGRCLIIGCIYKPPDTNIDLFYSNLAHVLDKINQENKIGIILGDFNINLLNTESHSLTADFLNPIHENSFYPLITKPTPLTPSSATLIDNIFTNSFSNEWKSGIFYSDISDHFPIFYIPSVTTSNHAVACKTLRFRKYNKRNID